MSPADPVLGFQTVGCKQFCKIRCVVSGISGAQMHLFTNIPVGLFAFCCLLFVITLQDGKKKKSLF